MDVSGHGFLQIGNPGPITDYGLAHLASLTSLEQLDISMSRVTDSGLTELRHLHNLKILAIAYTNVVGPGLMYLKGLDQLRLLDPEGCRIDGRYFDEIRKALPELNLWT